MVAVINRLENGARLFEVLFFKGQPLGNLSEKLVVGRRWTAGLTLDRLNHVMELRQLFALQEHMHSRQKLEVSVGTRLLLFIRWLTYQPLPCHHSTLNRPSLSLFAPGLRVCLLHFTLFLPNDRYVTVSALFPHD